MDDSIGTIDVLGQSRAAGVSSRASSTLCIAPGLLLAPFVEAFELPADAGGAGSGAPYTVLPSPQPVLGVQLSGRLAVVRGRETLALDGIGLTGLQTVSRRFLPEGETSTLLVRFTPYGAAALIGPQLGDLVDQQIGLAALLPPHFVELLRTQLAAASEPRQAARIVAAAVAAAVRFQPARAPAAVRRAADEIVRVNGEVRIATLAREIGVGTRALERGFRAYIGLSPKQFAGVARFARAAKQLGGTSSAARVAQDAGFADQAQFSRDFRRKAGMPPSAWRAAH